MQLIKSARSNSTLAQIVSSTGGFLVGWPIGTAIAGGEPNWALACAGAGMFAMSIPLSWRSNKKLVEAVAVYNSSVPSTSDASSLKFKIITNGNSVGLALNF